LSPFFVGALREASYSENFQERWMRTTAWDESCYRGKDVLDIINRNLAGAPPIPIDGTEATFAPARIAHLFFGNDDTPVVGPWVHPNGNGVFPDQPSDAGWNTVGNFLRGLVNRAQTTCAPAWAARMHFADGRQATVVHLDDLGDVFSKVNTHGFSLVSVAFPENAATPRVDVRWIPIPR
jgi:hypothetical protein